MDAAGAGSHSAGHGNVAVPRLHVAKFGHKKDLADRTLTKLYNQRPAWLDAAHKALDATVAAAYG